MISFNEGASYWLHTPHRNGSSFEQRLSERLHLAGVKDPRSLITDRQRQEQYEKLLGLTGNTPITLHEYPYAQILVKRLSQNLTESHYDRGYLMLLRQLEAEGIIWPSNRNNEHEGKRVELLELSSGSAGLGFGFSCNMLGFEATLLAPEELPKPRLEHIQAMGIRVELTPHGYIKATNDRLTQKIQALRNAGYQSVRWNRNGHRAIAYENDNHRVVFVNHSEAQIVVEAFKTPAYEIADFFPEGVAPDFFVNIIGNLTSSTAFLSVLRAKYPHMQVIGLEDMKNPDWYDKRYPGRFKQKFGYEPTFEAPEVYGSSQRGVPLYFAIPETLAMFDEIQIFDPREAKAYMARYNVSNGRSAVDSIGRSSAACLMVSEQVAKAHPGALIITLNYDKGDRYNHQVPAFTPQMALTDAFAYNRFERSKLQPPGWQQRKPITPIDVPRSLQQAYIQ